MDQSQFGASAGGPIVIGRSDLQALPSDITGPAVNDDRIEFPRSVRGTYNFSSLANFLSGTYNTAGFTQTFGETAVAQTNPNLGLYVQDEWEDHAGGDDEPRHALRRAMDRDHPR